MSEDATPLIVDVRAAPDGPVVTVAGELDMASADRLVKFAARQLRSAPRRLTIDLSGVLFCDSSGINALVQLRNLSAERGWDFRLVHLRPDLDRLIADLTGLREFLGIMAD
jgi:anti-sigma B factor antagonist